MSAEPIMESKSDNIMAELQNHVDEVLNDDFKLTETGNVKAKEYTKKLPLCITKNMDYLTKVEKFLRKEFNNDVYTMKHEIPEDEFEELSELQEIFDEIMEVISAYNNQEEFSFSRPSTKMNRLKKLASDFI